MVGYVGAIYCLFLCSLRNSLSLCYLLFCQFRSFAIMPPKKSAAPKKRAAQHVPAPVRRPLRPNKRARRGRLQPDEERDVTIAEPPKEDSSSTVLVNVGAIPSTISAVVTQAIKTAFSPENLASLIGAGNQQEAPRLVDQTVGDEVIAISTTHGQSGTDEGAFNHLNSLVNVNDPRPQSLFTSVSVPLTTRISSKVKAKIWANDYIYFATLLSDSPQDEGKYSLAMSPSVSSSSQPSLTLAPYHTSKRISNISQWVSAFSIFVSVYSERISNHTAQLMKYCEVVRDLASKAGDWHWYDEQFRYLRQSSPDQYPWDQIHWELWLRASNPFRRPQTPTPTNKRFRSQRFPRGTCWAFQAGKHCSGCQYEHVCYKCGEKHPGGQCSALSTKSRFATNGPKGKRDSPQAAGSAQQTGHTSKR